MPWSRLFARGCSVVLLILFMTAAAAAQDDSISLEQAENGDANSQYWVGMGCLVKEHKYREGANWVRKAADQGFARAQATLGGLYEKGLGVPQDYTQAVTWWRKAAEQGNGLAQYKLGRCYQWGLGVPKDYAQAEEWYEKALNNNDDSAASYASTEMEQSLAAMRASQQQQLNGMFAAIVCVGVVSGLLVMHVRLRKKLIGYGKKVIPRTPRTKQFVIVMSVASWCSACCLYQALDPTRMRHPINAAVTALLFSTPAVICGAVLLWWLSQAQRPTKAKNSGRPAAIAVAQVEDQLDNSGSK
jgi:hypothetical protein